MTAELYDLEADVANSRYQEMHLRKNNDFFRLGVIDGLWYLHTRKASYEARSINDVFSKAAKNYPEITSWVSEFSEAEQQHT